MMKKKNKKERRTGPKHRERGKLTNTLDVAPVCGDETNGFAADEETRHGVSFVVLSRSD